MILPPTPPPPARPLPPAENPAIKTLLGKARTCLSGKRYDCAISNAEAVLTLETKNKEAKRIRDQAVAGQEEALSQIGIE